METPTEFHTGVEYPVTHVLVVSNASVLAKLKIPGKYQGANGLVKSKRHAVKFPTKNAALAFMLDSPLMPILSIESIDKNKR
jgi:hypothetical protein